MKTLRRSSDGATSYDGTVGKLYQTSTKIAVAEARLWLIRQLLLNRLATRDVYYFTLKQADLRIKNKDPDPMTIKHAMMAKEKDIITSISDLLKSRKALETSLYYELGERRFKHRKILKHVKDDAKTMKEKKMANLHTQMIKNLKS